jgi:hypothetical protein
MFDVSPDQASAWFDIFNIVLFIGAFAVAVGTYGSIKMGEIKERFSNERLSTNEHATAQAQTEAAHANERAAGLEKDAALVKERAAQLEKSVAEANARAAEAQLALERFKAPRSLVPSERAAIAAAIAPYAGTALDIFIAGESPDLASLASGITTAPKHRTGYR